MSVVTEETNSSKSGSSKRWTPINIISILVGFIAFWPIGLFLLVWVLTNRNVEDLPKIVSAKAKGFRRWVSRQTHSGNRVFDEFQQTQFDRIDEIKAEISKREQSFKSYKDTVDRNAEEREFEEFMRKGPVAQGAPES